MAKGIKSVMRQANRLAKGMKNGEAKVIPNSKINGANAVVYRSRGNGMINLIGANYDNNSVARYFTSGNKYSVSASSSHAKQFKKLVFSNGAKFKKGSTGSRGG